MFLSNSVDMMKNLQMADRRDFDRDLIVAIYELKKKIGEKCSMKSMYVL